MSEYNPGYDKETLLKAYKDHFINDLPLIVNEVPEKIGKLITNSYYDLYSSWSEKEGKYFFFAIELNALQTESLNLKEIEAEKLAYMLSDSWGDISVKYDKQWSLTSLNDGYHIILIGKTIEKLFEHYNNIVSEVFGENLDFYLNY